ncbi:MAG: phosphotransferase, partial [Muribaculaceae bacterium]|nr:phosphotransferase [Muribaculaceae bacterium]
NVPQVLEVAPDSGCYLQQDLGDTSLFSMLHSAEGEAMVAETMRALPVLQLAAQVTDEMLYPVKAMSGEHVMADLNYFRYCFLKAVGVEVDEELILRDFRTIVNMVESTPAALQGLMLRDCQSRNVMVHEGEPLFIDFQSARRGPLLYDVASFLWQARAKFSADFRSRMTDVYFEALSGKRKVSRENLEESLRLMVIIRTLQVLGAYGLRGITQRKAHFLQSIPAALGNIRELLTYPLLNQLPELRKALEAVLEIKSLHQPEPAEGRLLVSVGSFSYKKGYPENFTGNGGGFMFDCRAMHNPGCYDEYKQLTGRDRPVIDFLEERGEVQKFLEGAMSLVAPAVERY